MVNLHLQVTTEDTKTINSLGVIGIVGENTLKAEPSFSDVARETIVTPIYASIFGKTGWPWLSMGGEGIGRCGGKGGCRSEVLSPAGRGVSGRG
jgi:hypothetical protein